MCVGVCWYLACPGTSQCLYYHVAGSVARYTSFIHRWCILRCINLASYLLHEALVVLHVRNKFSFPCF